MLPTPKRWPGISVRNDSDFQNIAVVGVGVAVMWDWCGSCPWFRCCCCCPCHRCRCCHHHPVHRFAIWIVSDSADWPHCNDRDCQRSANSGDLFGYSRSYNLPRLDYVYGPRYWYVVCTAVVVADDGSIVGYHDDPMN